MLGRPQAASTHVKVIVEVSNDYSMLSVLKWLNYNSLNFEIDSTFVNFYQALLPTRLGAKPTQLE